ncbi:guanylate kinase [candidate division WOR-3 bacterium]|uniref:Guanylate kinase n=1 Tax=candidate division WOR-3 bacterium TaxID=2052148 RepID=A0A938BS86_UNCW3|nr:guanylate kinase [candidate division WOR-3 bacterium]
MSSNALRHTRHAQRRATSHAASGVLRRASSVGHSPFLVVLSAPSGAGKTSICREVERRGRDIAYSVSATTRPRRQGEIHGRSYLFCSEKQFNQMSARNGLLESAGVYGHRYGTPKAPVLRHFRAGRDVIADLDVQGMRSCRKALPGTVSIFVTAPDFTELDRRLHGRGTESADSVKRREADREEELAAVPEFDYLVVNDRLEQAVDDVMAIVRSERLRTSRMSPTARNPKTKTEGRRPQK